jgi:hypothetical protein
MSTINYLLISGESQETWIDSQQHRCQALISGNKEESGHGRFSQLLELLYIKLYC